MLGTAFLARDRDVRTLRSLASARNRRGAPAPPLLAPPRAVRCALRDESRASGSGPTTVEWRFTPYGDGSTFVSITNSGFTGTGDEVVERESRGH